MSPGNRKIYHLLSKAKDKCLYHYCYKCKGFRYHPNVKKNTCVNGEDCTEYTYKRAKFIEHLAQSRSTKKLPTDFDR